MFCKNCGTNVSDDSVICPNCGVQVGEIKTSATDVQNDSAKKQAPNAVGLVGFILSMVGALFWLIGLFSSILFIVSIVLSIAAIVCSAIGMRNSAKNNAQFRGLSIAGLVVGIVTVSISLILFVIGIAALSVFF